MAKSQKSVSFETTLIKSPLESGWHFLTIEREIVDKFAFTGKSKRVVCSIKGGEPFQCALMPWGEIFYIIVNKSKRESAGIDAGDTVEVELVLDESKYGLPMPEEFQEVLNQDHEGDRLFHALTEGKQRSVLYYVSKIKDIDKRIHASLIFVDHLKENDGKIDNRLLMEELKRPLF
ncbi:hypothetical protein BH10ACI3_BH10ACI3_20960 [soil metagenome]